MPGLPTGTVTFLFTDIEGSTRLLARLGESYADVLAEHRRVVRGAIRAHDGAELGTEGDAFFVAFARAAEAVAAAAEAQAGLAGGDVRVRMGVHTGEPQLTEEGYVGLVLHEAARICSAGHGGQVLISAATRDMLDEFDGRFLGEHRLKDLARPIRLYQLGGEEFPPLRTLHRTSLPTAPTRLVGRVEELRTAAALLRRDDVRLLTMTGPGGSGKTRLALATAYELVDDYEGGTSFVALAPLVDSSLVAPAIAQTLELEGDLVAELADRHALLVLDNFEHVRGAAPLVGHLLTASPALNVLVTSREPLHLAGEREFAVPPLESSEAVALFRDRAQDAEPPEVVAEICRRLDYLPLAIELAASRTKSLAPAALLERLDRHLPVLTRGPRDAPERQRTLRATIDWSHALLDPGEATLFRRLGVFVGGCTLEAAEAVAGAELDTLDSLVDKSLLRHRAGRYTMLRTLREYALERLEEAGEAGVLRARHAGYFLDFAKAHRRAHARDVLERLGADHDNLRAARLELRESGLIDAELELAGALASFADVRGHWREERDAARAALARAGAASLTAQAAGWQALAQASLLAGEPEPARQAAERSLGLSRDARDDDGACVALFLLGFLAAEEGDYERAGALITDARELAARRGDEADLAGATANLGLYALIRGETQEGRALTRQSLEAFRRLGNDQGVVLALENLGIAELMDGSRAKAVQLLLESLDLAQAIGSTAGTFNALVALAAAEDDAARAATMLGATEALREEVGAERLEVLEARLQDDTLARLRAEYGEDAVAARLREGRELSVEDAVRLARGP